MSMIFCSINENHLLSIGWVVGIGMIGVVHDNTQVPIVYMDGIELATGFNHRLSYMQKYISYLPSPYSTCTDQVSRSMQAMFDYYSGADYAYSETLCYIICTQIYRYIKCGCVDPTLWDARAIILPETDTIIIAPLCNDTDPCYSKAADELLASDTLLNQYCLSCPYKCSMTNFVIRTSSSTTPPDWLLNDIKIFVENSSIPLAVNWSTEWRQHVRANFLAIELVRESTPNERYEQVATTSAVDLLSNVGGQTGLWIGISFLSLMEVVEMLYRLARHQFLVVLRALRKPTTIKQE
ncbi:unnamed protein product [Rotaria sp. Silwood2]|nr:unnamed protein product [Rotaria sp. Silwood2]CAF3978222.1 unnamed protein product [Rotaria sp. Silwood2]